MLGICYCATIDSQNNIAYNCIVNNQAKDLTDAFYIICANKNIFKILHFFHIKTLQCII